MSGIRWELNAIERLCCTVLSGENTAKTQVTSALLCQLQNDDFFLWAQNNEVSTTLTYRLNGIVNSEQIPQNWQEFYQTTFRRISSYLTELDHIAQLFHDVGIRLIALKNGGIPRGIYPYPGACPMGDLDILVERRHFRQAHQILSQEGYQFEFRSELEKEDLTTAEQNGGTEYWKMLPNGEKFWLELQWRPVSGRWIRPDQEPSVDEVMARSIPIAGTHVRLLAPEDNLLQVALHTAKHTYVRAPGFRLHLDVERIVRAYTNLDWQLFLERVKHLQVKTAVYFSLVIPYELFSTPIPEWVLQELRPPTWKEATLRRWLQKVGLFNPHEKKFGRIKYILFTSLLYDDLAGLWRGIFPARLWMQAHYGFQNRLWLPYYHAQRLAGLLFQRLAT